MFRFSRPDLTYSLVQLFIHTKYAAVCTLCLISQYIAPNNLKNEYGKRKIKYPLTIQESGLSVFKAVKLIFYSMLILIQASLKYASYDPLRVYKYIYAYTHTMQACIHIHTYIPTYMYIYMHA